MKVAEVKVWLVRLSVFLFLLSLSLEDQADFVPSNVTPVVARDEST